VRRFTVSGFKATVSAGLLAFRLLLIAELGGRAGSGER